MRKSLQTMLMVGGFLASIPLFSQRFLPLIAEGSSISQGNHGPEGQVSAMINYNDKLLMAGRFVSVNGVEMAKIAYWDGSEFSLFDADLPEASGGTSINDLLETPLGLVACGRYGEMLNIVVYDGSSWSTLGDGFDNTVFDIAWFNDELYAAGRFMNSGDTPMGFIARWDGANWQQVDGGMDDFVYDLEVYNNQLYAVGSFTSAGSELCSRIARLNGTQWEAVGSGFDGEAYCMKEINGDLLIGGDFINSGDQGLEYLGLASYNGDSFSQVYNGGSGIAASSIVQFAEDILVSERGSGYGLWMTNGNTYRLEGDELVELPSNWPNVHVVAELNGETYICQNQFEPELTPESFYLNNAVFNFLPGSNLNATIETDMISGLVYPSATLFNDIENSQGAYLIGSEAPSISSIYAAAPWISALSSDESLYLNYQTYSGNSEGSPYYHYGPFSESYDLGYLERYLRVWSLSAAEVENHISNFSEPGYLTPEAIANWPGNGRLDAGESTHLAPFEDLDEDGIYEPELGEYPVIRGDRCVFYLLSSDREDVAMNDTGVEIGVMIYAFDDQPETVFANYQVHNKSSLDYAAVKFGMWTDGDLGNSQDDYIGCNPENNFYFFYNGDDNDEPSASSPGFGDNIPMQAVAFLDRPMSHFISYNNSSMPNGNPQIGPDYHNYLNGIWRNWQLLYFGGDGFNTGTGADPENPTNYMYPSDPNLPAGDGIWHEAEAGNPSGDRRGVGSFEAIPLASGESAMFDVAFVSAFPETPGGEPEETFAGLLGLNSLMGQFYEEQAFSIPEVFPVGINELELVDSSVLSLYPNPGSDWIAISYDNQLIQEVRIIDLQGKVVLVESNPSTLYQLDISTLHAGIYLVQVSNDLGAIAVRKLIIE